MERNEILKAVTLPTFNLLSSWMQFLFVSVIPNYFQSPVNPVGIDPESIHD
jgi:hypothetical protein